MLVSLGTYFVVGLFTGMILSENYRYVHIPIGYLIIFFVTAVMYTIFHTPIDLRLFLFPLVDVVGVVVALKLRNKISR